MEPKLVQEQTLQMKMNQSLIQSLHLLQYTGIEIVEYIQELAKENPLIETVNVDDDISIFKTADMNDTSIGDMNQAEWTMYEQLKSQLYAVQIPDNLREAVIFGIDSLNEDGYLDMTLEAWAHACQITIDMTKQALKLIQKLEPAGIGARSLQECIQLQLPDKKALLEELLSDHLDWVAEEDTAAIADCFNMLEDTAADLLNQIQSCHPKPGHLLAAADTAYIIPEAYIYKENGEWTISFYKWHAPTINIDESYQHLQVDDKAAQDYLKEKYKQVNWLQQAVAFRGNTVEQIIEKIVEKQRLYFEHGNFMLQPLTLKDLAAALNMHPSTVSRAVSNKYIQTRRGVMPLKFFLQSGVKQQNGEQTASSVIKQLIAELIKQEDKLQPLSDQAIADRLQQEFGITAARRTVMKYRKHLGMVSSAKRK
ncbi:RNA polymerase factor sigma-54 [Barrientosiimonas marina]|uniref:RNA polymerase factor sigma-54 n=1 Tax=Lentibacillus kimchii TaxID=1542911 RepID=A0ABW2UUB1_9BACI